MTKYKRVYIAGAYSSDNIIGCLNNIRIGIKKCANILSEGKVIPFCPWTDFLFQFFNDKLTVEDYYKFSIAWLEVSDEIWVLPNAENSKGTQKEIERAKELNIPIKFL